MPIPDNVLIGKQVGEELRGKAWATYVLAKGRDGYQVVDSWQSWTILADRATAIRYPLQAVLFGSSLPETRRWLAPFGCEKA